MHVTRRSLLGIGLGGVATLLAACGGAAPTATPAAPATKPTEPAKPAATTAPTAAATTAPAATVAPPERVDCAAGTTNSHGDRGNIGKACVR